MKKIKYLFWLIMGFVINFKLLASSKINTDKIQQYSNSFNSTGNIAEDTQSYIATGVTWFAWFIIIASLAMVAIGVIAAFRNNTQDKKTDWTMSSALGQGAVVVVVCLIVGVTLLSFVS
jgi:hypothetical protein